MKKMQFFEKIVFTFFCVKIAKIEISKQSKRHFKLIFIPRKMSFLWVLILIWKSVSQSSKIDWIFCPTNHLNVSFYQMYQEYPLEHRKNELFSVSNICFNYFNRQKLHIYIYLYSVACKENSISFLPAINWC